MNCDWFDKLELVERKLSERHGPFVLFAIFQRVESPNTWDLVIAAPWAPGPSREGIGKVVSVIEDELTYDERGQISRIILLDPCGPTVRGLVSEHRVEHGRVEIGRRDFGTVSIERGYLITSRPQHLARAA